MVDRCSPLAMPLMAPEMVLANGFGTRVSVDYGVHGRQRSKEGSDMSIFLFFSLVVASESAHR
jgi:hypothetical protein